MWENEKKRKRKNGKKTKSKNEKIIKLRIKKLKNQIKKMFFWKKKTNKKIKEWKRKSGLQGVPPETAQNFFFARYVTRNRAAVEVKKWNNQKTHQTHPKNKKEKQKKRTPLNPGLWRSHSTLQASYLCSMFLQCMFFLVKEEEWLLGRLCSRCYHVGRAGTGEACLASGATPSSLRTVKKQNHLIFSLVFFLFYCFIVFFFLF